MVLAHLASETNNVAKTRQWLLLTLALGVCFLGFKAFEYHHEIADGNIPQILAVLGLLLSS
jgi:heme/copper-type cytochrome/quinol oxidase subunit 3